jgi:hypothetical protein
MFLTRLYAVSGALCCLLFLSMSPQGQHQPNKKCKSTDSQCTHYYGSNYPCMEAGACQTCESHGGVVMRICNGPDGACAGPIAEQSTPENPTAGCGRKMIGVCTWHPPVGDQTVGVWKCENLITQLNDFCGTYLSCTIP